MIDRLSAVTYEGDQLDTYLVFIPGVSLLLQKIQMANLLPLPQNVSQGNIQEVNEQNRKFSLLCKWHLRGSLTQLVVSAAAIKIFAANFFLLFAAAAFYELMDTSYHALQNAVHFYATYPNGSLREIVVANACNIF